MDRLLELGVSSEIVLVLQGKIHYNLHNLDIADGIFKKILENSPNHVDALHFIGKVAGYTDANYGVRQKRDDSSEKLKVEITTEDTVSGLIYSAKDEQSIIEKLTLLLGCKKYCIDIGALDGVRFSNTFALFSGGWSGLLFECSRENISALAKNINKLPQEISIIGTFVTPDNILKMLNAFEVPLDLGFISIDIDSYDFEVLEKILGVYRPRLICAEINERIPPPIKFRQLFSGGGKGVDNGIHGGCSISAYEELLRNNGYSIVHLEYNNLFAVQDVDLPLIYPAFVDQSAGAAWRAGFMDRPDKYSWMPWNKPFDYLFSLPVEVAIAEIRKSVPKDMHFLIS